MQFDLACSALNSELGFVCPLDCKAEVEIVLKGQTADFTGTYSASVSFNGESASVSASSAHHYYVNVEKRETFIMNFKKGETYKPSIEWAGGWYAVPDRQSYVRIKLL